MRAQLHRKLLTTPVVRRRHTPLPLLMLQNPPLSLPRLQRALRPSSCGRRLRRPLPSTTLSRRRCGLEKTATRTTKPLLHLAILCHLQDRRTAGAAFLPAGSLLRVQHLLQMLTMMIVLTRMLRQAPMFLRKQRSPPLHLQVAAVSVLSLEVFLVGTKKSPPQHPRLLRLLQSL